jgi:hypothetical protein
VSREHVCSILIGINCSLGWQRERKRQNDLDCSRRMKGKVKIKEFGS